MEEIWKDIEGYEGIYQVSNFGRVKSCERIIQNSSTLSGIQRIKERILINHIKGNGYHSVSLCVECRKHDFYIHRLVASIFIPNIENKNEVNHIDGNKSNNHVENLEWVTSKENVRHAFDKKLIDNGTIERRKHCVISAQKITKEQVIEFRKLRKHGASYDELSKKFGLSKSYCKLLVNENTRKSTFEIM